MPCPVWSSSWTLSPPLWRWQVTVWSWYLSCCLCFSSTLWWTVRLSLEQKCLPKSISARDTPVVVWGLMRYWERTRASKMVKFLCSKLSAILSDIYSGLRNAKPSKQLWWRCCIVSSEVAVIIGMTSIHLYGVDFNYIWRGSFALHRASKIDVQSGPGFGLDFVHS